MIRNDPERGTTSEGYRLKELGLYAAKYEPWLWAKPESPIVRRLSEHDTTSCTPHFKFPQGLLHQSAPDALALYVGPYRQGPQPIPAEDITGN
jgi:hypothetical protein